MNFKFIKNTLFFGFALGLNNFFPILLIPFYTKILGLEFYGNFALSSAIIAYVILISDYGFNIGAVRLTSINQNRLKFIFTGVIACRSILTVFLISSLFIYLFIFKKSQDIVFILCVLSISAVFNIISSQWIFVSLEKLKEYAVISFLSKIPSLVLLCFISTYHEEWYALLIAVLPSVILNVACFIYIKIKFNIDLKFKFISMKYLFALMNENKNYFISSAGGSLFNNANIVLMGFFFGPVQVGYYSIAEKIVKIFVFINAPVTQLTFSKIAKNVESINIVRNILKKSFIYQAGGMLFISLCFYLCVDQFASRNLFLIDDEIYQILKIMAFAPFFTSLSDIFGNNIMLNYGLGSAYSKIFIFCGILNIFSIVILSNYFDFRVVAYSFISSEIILCAFRAYFVFRYRSYLLIYK